MFKVRSILKFHTNCTHACALQKRLIFKRIGRLIGLESETEGRKHDSLKSNQVPSSSEKKSQSIRRVKVGIIGGGTASFYTSLLLKQSATIKSINLINAETAQIVNALDANHIDTSARIKCYTKNKIAQALDKVDIVAIMEESDVTTNNKCYTDKLTNSANYIRRITEQLLEHNPDALVVVFVQPVTISLPMISEIYEWAGFYDPNKIIGSTALYSMRLDVTTARFLDLNPELISVPLSGGADAATLVPLLSCAKPFNEFNTAQVDTLVQSFRSIDYDVTLRDSRIPALSVAAASAKMILVLAAGLRGNNEATACAYVRSNIIPGCRYFTSNLQFGLKGVEKNFGIPKVSQSELSLIDQVIPIINEHTKLGINAVRADKHVKMESI